MKKQDWIVIAVVLCLAGIIFAILHGGGQHGAYVQVQVNNETIAVLPLHTDTEKVIQTEYGVNTLVIRDGYASVSEADCPDKICVRHRKICRSGESIICLPHRLVITVIKENDSEEIDI